MKLLELLAVVVDQSLIDRRFDVLDDLFAGGSGHVLLCTARGRGALARLRAEALPEVPDFLFGGMMVDEETSGK